MEILFNSNNITKKEDPMKEKWEEVVQQVVMQVVSNSVKTK
jgi:hypothetical protein